MNRTLESGRERIFSGGRTVNYSASTVEGGSRYSVTLNLVDDFYLTMDAISEYLRVVHSLWFFDYSIFNVQPYCLNLQSTGTTATSWLFGVSESRFFFELNETAVLHVVWFLGAVSRRFSESWFLILLLSLSLAASLFVRFYKNELFFLSWAVRDVTGVWGETPLRWEVERWGKKETAAVTVPCAAVIRDGTVQSCMITVIIEYYYTHFHYLTS
jgi:hypothetical protein